MKRWIIFIALAALIFLSMGIYSVGYVVLTGNQIISIEDVSEIQEPIVDIENFAYSPKQITIRIGTTVEWTNLDLAKQTVTSEGIGPLNSGLLENGKKYSYTFKEVGEYNYYCVTNPYMKGKIIVVG